MAVLGTMNTLQVIRQVEFGVYLDGDQYGDILLPNREMPKDAEVELEDWLNVFIYLDSEDRVIATTRKPKAQVGEFASLKVVDINRVGLFLDWGLSKDLLLPHSEEKKPLQVDDYVVVYVYQDERTGRLVATAHLDSFLQDTAEADTYAKGQAVSVLIAERTDLGYKAIIDKTYWGLIHNNEVFKFIRPGMQETAYIREIREDGRISLSLQSQGAEMRDELAERILQAIDEAGGRLALSDKSPAAEIAEAFGVSKGNFKKALGGLYKQQLISIYPTYIERTAS